MRRIQIRAQDVLWPFFILLSINVTLLLGWTLKSPFKYHRVLLNNYDLYGREIESYGICKSDDTKFYYFLFPILLVNLIGLGIATYQSWIARNLPTEFSESYYLAISMASLFESLALGGPIVYMTFDNSTAFYLVGSALICICCLTILLPVFVPKYNHRKAAPTGRNRSSVLTGARSRISAPSGGLRVKNANESWGKMQIARSNSGISRNSGLSLGATGSGHGTEVLALPNASNYSGIGSLAEDSQIFDEKGK